LSRPLAWHVLRLGRGAAGVLGVWAGWERSVDHRQRIRPVREGAVLRFGRACHRGPAVILRDGTVVDVGDPIIELHLDNRRLAQVGAARMPPWALLRLFRDDLAALGRDIAEGRLGPVRALRGVTLLAAAAPRLGFEVRRPPRSPYQALRRFFMAGLIVLHHPAGWDALRGYGGRWPAEVWMSAGALERRARADATATSSPISAMSTSLNAR
jgi:peptidoglycan-N-acetylglucosamine deacetylase